MLTEETVFIIGAGSSVPYGYPTGEALKKRIVALAIKMKNDIEEHFEKYHPNGIVNSSNTDNLRQFIRMISTVDADRWRLLSSFLEAIQIFNSRSIDSFLSEKEKDRALVELAKELLVKILLACEYCKLPEETDEDWIRDIYSFITDSYDAHGREYVLKQKIYIVNFNYDKRLTSRLYKLLDSSDRFDEEFVRKFFNDCLNMIHVYGELRKLPHEIGFRKSDSFECGAEDFKDYIAEYSDNKGLNFPYMEFQADYLTTGNGKCHPGEMAKRIKFMWDKPDDNKLHRIRGLITDAKRIVILGYSFDDRNNALLGLERIDYSSGHKYIYYTNYDADKLIERKIDRLFGKDVKMKTKAAICSLLVELKEDLRIEQKEQRVLTSKEEA